MREGQSDGLSQLVGSKPGGRGSHDDAITTDKEHLKGPYDGLLPWRRALLGLFDGPQDQVHVLVKGLKATSSVRWIHMAIRGRTCRMPLSSRPPFSLIRIFSSRLSLIKSRGCSSPDPADLLIAVGLVVALPGPAILIFYLKHSIMEH